MKQLSTESINKLRKLEDDFISQKMQDSGDKNGLKPYLETMAKNQYKNEFCQDLIKNFDTRMDEIGHSPLTKQEKAEYLSGLAVYSINLEEYNKLLKDRNIMTGDSRRAHDEVTRGSVTDTLDKPKMTVEKEPLDLTELKNEELDKDPFETEESTRKTILGSIADFFGAVHKFWATGLVSWYRGYPLDDVKAAYDMVKNMSPEDRAAWRSGDYDADLGDDEDSISHQQQNNYDDNDYDDEMTDDDEIDISSKGKGKGRE